MHEFQRFIQSELDARGWRQADLVQKSGLSRQHVSNLVRDTRPNLGQMPDTATLDGLARGFGIPVDRVRTAAARSLVGYEDDGEALTVTLGDVSTDALLNEIRRRIDEQPVDLSPANTPPATQPGTPSRAEQKTPAVVSEVLPGPYDHEQPGSEDQVGHDADSGTDPEGQAADGARPNVWRDDPADDSPTSLTERRSRRGSGDDDMIAASDHSTDTIWVDGGTAYVGEPAAHDRGPDDKGENEQAADEQDRDAETPNE